MTGVFFHATPEGAAFYVVSSRQTWPLEPMCFLELLAISANKVKGGMDGRYCAKGEVGRENRKVELVALWILQTDVYC